MARLYGTILVDLELHQVIDLLPERSAESFAAWLSKHPEVEIITRDRGEQYSQGATLFGAADREDGRPGRPTRWDDALRENLRELLSRSPREYGHTANVWTVPLMQEYVRRRPELSGGENVLPRKLHKLGYIWKRVRYVLTPDPELEKIRQILHQPRKLPPRSVILAEDEGDLRLFPPSRSNWSIGSSPAEVELGGANAKRVLFGCLNLRTGHRLRLAREHQRGEDFRELLNVVQQSYRAWPTVLLLDEDLSHTPGAGPAWAKKHRIHLEWLPKRSPHQNPMDHLWRHVKGMTLANRQETSIDDLDPHASNHLPSLAPREALRKADLLSPDHWLKRLLKKMALPVLLNPAPATNPR